MAKQLVEKLSIEEVSEAGLFETYYLVRGVCETVSPKAMTLSSKLSEKRNEQADEDDLPF